MIPPHDLPTTPKALPTNEKLAQLAHEFAHQVNGVVELKKQFGTSLTRDRFAYEVVVNSVDGDGYQFKETVKRFLWTKKRN